MAVEDIATIQPITRAETIGILKKTPMNIVSSILITTCKPPNTNTEYRNENNLLKENSKPTVNINNATPNSDKSLMTAVLANQPKPCGPTKIPTITYPRIIGILKCRKITVMIKAANNMIKELSIILNCMETLRVFSRKFVYCR